MLEIVLTAGCALVELGLPVALLLASRTRERLRSKAVVVLGAVSPLVALYAHVLVRQLADPGVDRRWAFGAVWVMTFLPYVACVLLGVALAFVPRPTHLGARYLLGLAVPAGLALLVLGAP